MKLNFIIRVGGIVNEDGTFLSQAELARQN